MTQRTNKNIPRRNKYILENILLNIFKFYILKFLQSHDNNKKKFDFHNFANTCKKLVEYRLRTSGLVQRLVNTENVITHPILATIFDESAMMLRLRNLYHDEKLFCDSLILDVFDEWQYLIHPVVDNIDLN